MAAITHTMVNSDLNPSPELERKGHPAPDSHAVHLAYPRHFHGGRHVYTVISPRAGGLSIGVNMNPDRYCDYDCVYCEVAGAKPKHASPCDVWATCNELESLLVKVQSGQLRLSPPYRQVPPEWLALKEVALSGDGEPTLCPNFDEALRGLIRLRAMGTHSFFKFVLITNTSGLLRPEVEAGLRLLTERDEVWAKLDAGTQEQLRLVNRTDHTLEQILERICRIGQERPVVIQSLFPLLDNTPPPAQEIEAYIDRLKWLQTQNTRLAKVQIYSAHRPPWNPSCGHLPLRTLSRIAQQVRDQTGLDVGVY